MGNEKFGIESSSLFTDKWSKLLTEFRIKKVGIYSNDFSENKKYLFLSEMVKNVPNIERLSPALVTYLGFKQKPSGVLFRSIVEKKFKIYPFLSSKLVFYVSESFENQIEKFKYGTPIVLLEGILDVEAFVYLIQYPYVLGYLTSNVSFILAGVFSSFTDKILLIPDNDKAGNEGKKKSLYNFERFDVKVNICNTMEKDFAEVYLNQNSVDVLKVNRFLSVL